MKREEDDGWHQKCLSGSLNFEGSEGHWLDWVGGEKWGCGGILEATGEQWMEGDAKYVTTIEEYARKW